MHSTAWGAQSVTAYNSGWARRVLETSGGGGHFVKRAIVSPLCGTPEIKQNNSERKLYLKNKNFKINKKEGRGLLRMEQ